MSLTVSFNQSYAAEQTTHLALNQTMPCEYVILRNTQ
jgi:hypothetical protein